MSERERRIERETELTVANLSLTIAAASEHIVVRSMTKKCRTARECLLQSAHPGEEVNDVARR